MNQTPHREIPFHTWLAEPLPPDVRGALERLRRTDDVCHVAVMPDVHLARDVCVGTVVATRRLLLPQAVGSDIGCGMAALAFEADADLLADEHAAAGLLQELYRAVPVMRHAGNRSPELPAELLENRLSNARLEKLKARDGRVQFGTLGRGNHFLEFQCCQEDRLWIMVHSGSRAMGEAIANHHLAHSARSSTGLAYLDAESGEGRAYLDDAEWAAAYAQASRQWMLEVVAELMSELFGIEPVRSSVLHCNHNHARRETHDGEVRWVHRKGAISANEGELGIVPGSMGTASYHVAGRGLADALRSSSHGAGRAMSRSEARRRIGVKSLERQMRGIWFDHRRAAGLREESPEAYKDIDAVMRAQSELTRVVRRLRPVLSYKGT
jgi:tRNA-splicing ligase RtcB